MELLIKTAENGVLVLSNALYHVISDKDFDSGVIQPSFLLQSMYGNFAYRVEITRTVRVP